MADKIVVVGLEVGDDYTSLSAALSAVPADLTTTGFDNWVIQCRSDQTHAGFTVSGNTTDATHRLVIEAYSGDECDGTGTGATIEQNRGLGIVRAEIDYIEVNGFYINQLGTSRTILISTGCQNPTIKNCFVQSSSGDTVEVSNGVGDFLNIDNSILVNTGGAICLDFGNGTDFTTRTINKTTAIGGTIRSFDQVSTTESQERKTIYTNCLAFPSGGGDGYSVSSPIFESDYNAASDTTGTSASSTTGFNNRVIGTDLEDPTAPTPNYNLKSTSTLKGAGLGGSDVGATLPASTSSGINVTPATVGSTWATNNYTVDLTGSIDITPQSVGSTWAANNYTVDLTGEISVTPQSVGSTWTANNYTVQLDAGIVVTPESVGSTWAANNYGVVLSGVIDITPQSVGSSWQANGYTVTLSSVVINGKHVRRVNAKIKNVRIGAKSKIKRFN